MAQSLFGSFMLYISQNFYTVFLKYFYWQNILLQSFSLNELGWMATMPYVANSILNRPTGPFIPLPGKTAVMANLI